MNILLLIPNYCHNSWN